MTSVGSIKVYTGPMFSSKTEAIIGAYDRALIAKKSVVAFKPVIDDRYGNNIIKSRGRLGKIEAIEIRSIDEILKHEAEIYIVDEFQFLKGDVSIIRDMADDGKIFHIAGLDMTAEGKPFGIMPNLLSIANIVQKFVAICMDCKDESATYSFYLGQKSEDIKVESMDKEKIQYIPLCRKCWKRRMEMKAQGII